MKKYKSLSEGLLLFLSGLSIVVLTVLNVTFMSSASKQENIVGIVNKTKSIQVVSTRVDTNQIEVTLANISNKDITAYVVSLGEHFTLKEDFIYSEADAAIKPGQNFTRKVPIPSGLKAQSNKQITILAVVFDDETSDGDQKIVKEIRDERLGEKIQLIRILPVLDNFLNSSDRESTLDLELRQEIASALDKSEAETLEILKKDTMRFKSTTGQEITTVPEQIRNGLQTGKENILSKIQQINYRQQSEGPLNIKEEIAQLKQQYEKVLARL